MAKNYKGFTATNGEVFEGGEYVRPTFGKYSIDGERLSYWELLDKIQSGTNMVQAPKVVQESGTNMVQDKKPEYSINGIVYPTIRAASEATGTPTNTLLRWCKANKNGCSLI